MTQTPPHCFHEICEIFKITDLNRFLANVPILCDLKTREDQCFCGVDCLLLSYHVRVSEWIYTLKFALMSRNSLLEGGAISEVLSDSNEIRTFNHLVRKRTLNHIAKLVKWLSVHLRTKWLWVLILLLSLFVVFLGVVK